MSTQEDAYEDVDFGLIADSTAPLQNWADVPKSLSGVVKGVGDSEREKLKRRVVEKVVHEKEKVMPHWRKVVTGDKEKRIRDYVMEETGALRLDELAFTMGVLAMLVTEYIILMCPGYFWLWYLLLTPVLFGIRVWQYSAQGYGYFLYDFCYFATVLCFLGVLLFPENAFLYRVNFAFAAGPLAWACVLWRNSLVFHSMDKMTSVFLHFMPGLLMIDWRCSCTREDMSDVWIRKMSCAAVDHPSNLLSSFIVYPCGFYLLWQMMYYIKTEVIDKRKLDENPNMQTSLRWLATDAKNGMNQFVRKCMVHWGVFEKHERFDPSSSKTKVVFITTQFIYTVITLLPVVLLDWSYAIHVSVYLYIMFALIRNGAAYYIKVFSSRYRQQVAKKSEEHKKKLGLSDEVASPSPDRKTRADTSLTKDELQKD